MPTQKDKKTAATKKTVRRKSSGKQRETDEGAGKNVASSVTLTPGPRKKRAKGPSVRLSNHKARSVWFQARTTWPVREAPVRTLVRERTRVQRALAAPANITSNWECVGPTNIGGRLTCIVCHPQHPERIWVGAAGGGVWQSYDSGQTWQSFWSDQEILNIGALAIRCEKARYDLLWHWRGKSFTRFISWSRPLPKCRRRSYLATTRFN